MRQSEINVEIDDELVVIILLSSLPDSFENFVIGIETRDELPLLKLLKLKQMEEGARRHERINKVKDVDQGEHAFVARSKKYSKVKNSAGGSNSSSYESSKKGKRINSKCFNCGCRGHFASHCKEAKR